jgi:hypothetical protein
MDLFFKRSTDVAHRLIRFVALVLVIALGSYAFAESEYHATLFYGSWTPDGSPLIDIKYETQQPAYKVAYSIGEFIDGKYVKVESHDPHDKGENYTWSQFPKEDIDALIRENARSNAVLIFNKEGVDVSASKSQPGHPVTGSKH